VVVNGIRVAMEAHIRIDSLASVVKDEKNIYTKIGTASTRNLEESLFSFVAKFAHVFSKYKQVKQGVFWNLY
jgi:hypothetical protein